MTNEAEEWRAVVGYEGLYEVSNLARVRGVERSHVTRGGITRHLKSRVLKQTVSKRGYYIVAMHNHGQKTKTVHRLVAEAFIPNPNNLPVVRHLNDEPLDNRLENLEWGTQGDNIRDLVRNGHHRSWWASRTECVNGHPYTEENTYWDPTRNYRRCRQCRKEENDRARIARQMGA